MAQLYTNKPIFLARFDFGTDENNITIKYKYILKYIIIEKSK